MSPASDTAEESALAAVAEVLSCPVCARGLVCAGRVLRCDLGHSFDIARQGYVSLLTGAPTKLTGDTAGMLDARAVFQGVGFFEPIAAAVADAARVARNDTAPPSGAEVIADIGAGTGYYLAHVLDAVPTARGIALDIAKPAGRRCARAHPRAAAVVADAWRGLPLRDRTLTAALSVFAPRNPAAVARCLAPGGRYFVVTPTARHLAELIGPIGMVTVDPDKERRLADGMAGLFTRVDSTAVEYPMALTRADIAHLVAMGPSAHHTAATAEQLPEPFEVTTSVTVSTYRALPAATGTGPHRDR
ncbi:methyltransferase type 11 [Nocardia flavorosea]|uniref:putative RNA methyltransferase n=1 Tax=Nocardia flavorosea TaxID=53429 RepID=UPI001893D12F|nr:methyltransferase domain-containing protein [Nocardia flavorosea]MBF6350723.1 methyltransferase type 11 [Nocardia flavorosea]